MAGSPYRSRRRFLMLLLVSVCLLLGMSLLTADAYSRAPTSEPEGTVAILAPENIDLELRSGVAELQSVTIQNKSGNPVNLEFCMVLGTNKPCEPVFEDSDGVYSVTVQAVKAGASVSSGSEGPGESGGESDSSVPTPSPTPSPIPLPTQELTLPAGGFKTYQLQFTATYSETDGFPAEGLSGLLVVQTTSSTDTLSAYVPLTIAARQEQEPAPASFLTTALSGFWGTIRAGRIVGIALLLSTVTGIGAAIVALRDQRIAHLRFPRPGDRANPLLRLRMGIAEWKLDESWASSLVVIIGVFSALSGILPAESAILTASAWKAFGFVFSIMTGVAAFVYNATTRPGPGDVSEGESNKEGRMWVWVLTAVGFTGWSLLAQLGLQALMLEALRANPDNALPDGLINFLQIVLGLLLIYACAYYIPRGIHQALKAQKLNEQADELVPQPAYERAFESVKDIVGAVRDRIARSHDIGDYASTLVQPLQHRMRALHDDLVELHCVEELEAGEGLDQSGNAIVSDLYQLFSCNLRTEFDVLTGSEEPGAWEKAIGILDEVIEDANEAMELVRRRKKAEVVAIAFYTSLGAPCSRRTGVYERTKDRILYYIGIAKAQLTDVDVELDKVLDADQHLFPNLVTALDTMNSELGATGDDPFYATLNSMLLKTGKNELMTVANREELKNKLEELKTRVDQEHTAAHSFCESCEEPPPLGEFQKALAELLQEIKDVPTDTERAIRSYIEDSRDDLYSAMTIGQDVETLLEGPQVKGAHKAERAREVFREVTARKAFHDYLDSYAGRQRAERASAVAGLMTRVGAATPSASTRRVALL